MAVPQLMQKRLNDANELLKQTQGLNAVSSAGGKILKAGELGVEFKSQSKDGGKTGTLTAVYHGLSGKEEIAKLTYGGGQGQFSNIYNALQEAQNRVILKLHRQIGQWEQIAKKYK